jgi:hypothetical protein
MKPPMPRVLRRGALIRVAGAGEAVEAAAPAYAISFVDLRFEDEHVERWLGAGELRDEEAVAYANLVAWGRDVAQEHSLIGDLGMAFSARDRDALEDAPWRSSSSGTRRCRTSGAESRRTSAEVVCVDEGTL